MRAAKAAQQHEDAAGDGQPADGNAPEGDFGSRMLQQLQAKRKAIGVVPQTAGGTGAPAQQEQPGIRGEEPELDYGEEGEEGDDVGGEGEEAGASSLIDWLDHCSPGCALLTPAGLVASIACTPY